MVFSVVYLDKSGKSGIIKVEYGTFDLPGIAREAREKMPGIDVWCIINYPGSTQGGNTCQE